MKETLSEVVFSREQIQERVRAMGEEINSFYKGEPVVVVCVLKGAFMFFSDLVRHLNMAPKLDFVRIASYGNKNVSESRIFFTKDVEVPLEGQHVLVVEDIVDTGRSMNFLFSQLAARGAKSLRLCALVDKHERREVGVHVDFSGFSIPEGFIVGYGLDYAERYRELPDIRILELS